MNTSREQTSVLIGGVDCAIAYPMHSVELYKERTGDSLLDLRTWEHIRTEVDPTRWLTCLWVGLQEECDGRWESPFTFEELGGLIGFGDVARITRVMSKAMALDLGMIRNAIIEAAEREALAQLLDRMSKDEPN